MRSPRVAVRLAARLGDTLTARQQEVYDLHRAGQSFGAIADLLKISKPTAWQHFVYARAKLVQQSLREQGLLASVRSQRPEALMREGWYWFLRATAAGLGVWILLVAAGAIMAAVWWLVGWAGR